MRMTGKVSDDNNREITYTWDYNQVKCRKQIDFFGSKYLAEGCIELKWIDSSTNCSNLFKCPQKWSIISIDVQFSGFKPFYGNDLPIISIHKRIFNGIPYSSVLN